MEVGGWFYLLYIIDMRLDSKASPTVVSKRKNDTPIRNQTCHPAHTQSLYRLSYPSSSQFNHNYQKPQSLKWKNLAEKEHLCYKWGRKEFTPTYLLYLTAQNKM
jgi:hypothetical protein